MTSGSPSRRCRAGALAKFLFGLAVVFAALCLAWMLFLPMLASRVVTSVTGFPMRVDALSVNPFTASVRVRGLVLDNPDVFPVKDFVHLRSFVFDAELSSLWGDTFVIDDAAVDVSEVTLVKDRTHGSNLQYLQSRLGGGDETKSPSKSEKPGSSASRKFLIKRLELRFDRLKFVDCTGAQPSTREMKLDFHQTYENVTSPVQIAVPIVGRVTALGGVVGDFAGKLGEQARDAARKAGETLKETGKKAEGAIKDLLHAFGKRGD